MDVYKRKRNDLFVKFGSESVLVRFGSVRFVFCVFGLFAFFEFHFDSGNKIRFSAAAAAAADAAVVPVLVVVAFSVPSIAFHIFRNHFGFSHLSSLCVCLCTVSVHLSGGEMNSNF